MRRVTWETIGLTILWIIVILIVVASNVKAQDESINTWFHADCVEWLDESHYRIHFGYTSDGVEEFVTWFDNVNAGSAFVTMPNLLLTSAGQHDDWYLDAHTEDSPYTFNVTFRNELGITTLPLNTWDIVVCDPAPAPEPTQAPVAQQAVSQVAVVSTGRTCAIQYPKIILVCNG